MMVKTRLYHIEVADVLEVHKHKTTYDRVIKKANKNGDPIWYITGASRLFKVERSVLLGSYRDYWEKEEIVIEETPNILKFQEKYPEEML